MQKIFIKIGPCHLEWGKKMVSPSARDFCHPVDILNKFSFEGQGFIVQPIVTVWCIALRHHERGERQEVSSTVSTYHFREADGRRKGSGHGRGERQEEKV